MPPRRAVPQVQHGRPARRWRGRDFHFAAGLGSAESPRDGRPGAFGVTTRCPFGVAGHTVPVKVGPNVRHLVTPSNRAASTMSITQTASDPTVQASRAFFEYLTAGYQPRDFAVRFWDGSTWEPDTGRPALFTLALRHPGAVRAMFWPPNGVAFGEAYINNDFDIEGDLYPFFRLTHYLNNLQ